MIKTESSVKPLILFPLRDKVILFVPADPVASNIIISCPSVGLAGSVNVLAAAVSTKYLRPATNVVFAEIARVDDISSLFNLPNTDKFQINITEGVGAGILYPKTNTTLLEKDRYDEFHLAGYGVSINAGLNLTFFKHFFMQLDLKGGYIDMPDIRTTSNTAESASQHFLYLQRVIAFGGGSALDVGKAIAAAL